MFNRGYLWFIATSLIFMASIGLCRAQEAKQPPAKSEVREAWRKVMVRTPFPKKGCFTASYPDKEWHEVACSTAKPFPPQVRKPGTRGSTPQVGAANGDFSAQTSGLYTSAEGTFNSVTPGVSEASNAPPGTPGATANSFSLQINTNTFTNPLTTTLCTGAANPSMCQGWVQFVFQNNLPPAYCTACVSVWYWLVPYGGATCPAGFTADVGDCYISSTLAPVTLTTISSLASMTLTGKISGGNDIVILDDNNGLTASVSD
ncbi:MAG TPA: hypothetical protein VG759_19705, partial [Candidatus Angelobacter sp.]|nr:hypothetical protein [Candidatus Angelobacter sp.]